MAVNTRSNTSVFRIAFSVVRVAGSTVTPTNTALAFASCSSCETVAVAIQIVLASNDANDVAPVNQAVALNYECTACDTFASAYQDLVLSGGPVHFTPTGNREMAAVRKQLQQLRHQNLSITALQADVTGLEQQVAQVVATQLVAGGPPVPPADRPASGALPADASSTTTSSTPTTSGGPGSSSGSSTTSSSSTTSTTTSSSTSTTTADKSSGTTTTSSTTSTTSP